MEAKSRPILNTQPVFKPALKILHSRFLGMRIDLRWFTGVRVSPSICFREALGNWAQSQSLDRFWAEAWFAGSGARLDWGRGYQRFMSHQHGGHSGCL
jgi:hypothetical protein